jgi:hypothetical protein
MARVVDSMGSTQLNENARCANLRKSSPSPDDEIARASSLRIRPIFPLPEDGTVARLEISETDPEPTLRAS